MFENTQNLSKGAPQKDHMKFSENSRKLIVIIEPMPLLTLNQHSAHIKTDMPNGKTNPFGFKCNVESM